ncbi:MAG TPA: class I SAM-dependent methyltransferase, partial [Planctomycetaceae bacterium]|nr:class I SAM-dependent methyltransferase [Planctomycetaceae bacterium]
MTPRTKTKLVVAVGRRRQVEYGDFQTPLELAEDVCRRLGDQRPVTIVEPTCGVGTFLAAAVRRLPGARRALAFDVNASHVAAARQRISEIQTDADIEIHIGDFSSP